MAPIRIERPEGEDAIGEFVALHDRVYASRPARWRASPLHLPMLLGQTPVTKERELQPFVAREGGELVARVCAAVDGPYLRHWNERVGHLLMFEALPHAREAVRQLLDEACAWLAERGMEAARNGFGLFDMPFNTDAYDALPPSMLRQNAPEIHALIKSAFRTRSAGCSSASSGTRLSRATGAGARSRRSSPRSSCATVIPRSTPPCSRSLTASRWASAS